MSERVTGESSTLTLNYNSSNVVRDGEVRNQRRDNFFGGEKKEGHGKFFRIYLCMVLGIHLGKDIL